MTIERLQVRSPDLAGKPMSIEDVIRNVSAKSEIAHHSPLFEEIHQALTELQLNLAFFTFQTSRRSACARTLDGRTVPCPALTLYLKYDEDVQQTGIDRRSGNWDDKWPLTGAARNALNVALHHHRFKSDAISDRTLIFVDSLETLAFRELGRQCRPAVEQLIREAAPGVNISHVFWNGQQYDVILNDKADYKRAKRIANSATEALRGILAAADMGRHCRTYPAVLQFGYAGMNLFHSVRQDLQ